MDAAEVHDGDASRRSPRSSAFVRIVIDRGQGLAGVHESAESVLAELVATAAVAADERLAWWWFATS